MLFQVMQPESVHNHSVNNHSEWAQKKWDIPALIE